MLRVISYFFSEQASSKLDITYVNKKNLGMKNIFKIQKAIILYTTIYAI